MSRVKLNYSILGTGLLVLALVFSVGLFVGCGLLGETTYILDVGVNKEEAGSVHKDPELDEYIEGETVTLTAVPNAGWEFKGWVGEVADSESATATVLMDEDKEITAVFERMEYSLEINIVGEGELEREVLSTPAEDYEYETVIQLTAVPDTGWKFSEWSGDEEGTDPVIEVEMDEDKEITAVFEREEYTLTVNKEGNGSVDIDPIQDIYFYGDEVTITAVPEKDWGFSEWIGDIESSDEVITIVVTDNTEITAIFLQFFIIEIEIEGEGEVKKDPDKEKYLDGTIVELNAIPEEDWGFSHWSGDISGDENPIEIVVKEDMQILVIFLETYNLDINIIGEGQVIKTPDHEKYIKGTIVELEAISDHGRSFSHWDGDVEGENESIEIEIQKDIEITAVFQLFAGGNGTEEDPYLIGAPDHLAYIWNYLDKHFRQIEDIDLSDYANWYPIGIWYGQGYAENEPFTGVFEGNGYSISNLKIDRTNDGIGLFGYIKEGEIKNISLTEVKVTGGKTVGAIVGILEESTIKDSFVEGNIKGSESFVGGLVGKNDESIIISSYFEGDVKGEGWYTGGLVGSNSNGLISQSYSTGEVRGGWKGTGGLVGRSWFSGTITRSYSTSFVSGQEWVGGLVGYNTANIINCYAKGSVSGSEEVGGLVGYNSGDIDKSFAVGFVSGYLGLGGLVGVNHFGSVKNSYYNKETTDCSDTGKGIPKTTEEMMQQATFEPEWDFDTIWAIDEGINYPYLQWE